MKRHRSKLIAAIVIVALLGGAWFFGGSTVNTDGEDLSSPTISAQTMDLLAQSMEAGLTSLLVQDLQAVEDMLDEAEEPQAESEEEPQEGEDDGASESETTSEPSPEPSETPTPTPPPTEQQPANDGTFTVTLSVRADTILNNLHLLDSAKHDLVPANGVIFAATQVTVTEGESVFDVLQREMRRVGIHMASRFTPLYSSAYVEAINNLYEFDVGPLSGWMYRVNGSFPGVGASQQILKPGDVVEWLYTVDLGRDIGGGF